MKPGPLWVLMGKDLRLHGLPLMLVAAGVLASCALAMRFAPHTGAVTGFVFNVNMLMALLLTEWLIARERAARSFAWLRTLPLDDRALVVAKFLLAAVFCVMLWTVSSGLFAPTLWSPWGTGLVLQCSLLVFGALCLGARWRINWHYAHLAPLAVMAAPVLLFTVFAGDDTARRAALTALWNAPYGRPLAAGGLLLLYLSVVWTTVRWVERADTYEFVD